MDLYIVVSFYDKISRCANIFVNEEEARDYVLKNGFDVWEGFTNKYVLIEKMPVGSPWELVEVAWYSRERLAGDEGGAVIFEIDKPKEYEGIVNFGVG